MINPLLMKEFRQRMRTDRAPVMITGYLCVMALLTFFLLHENVQGQVLPLLPTKSEQVFVTLSLFQIAVVGFMAPAFAAGSISGERERRTLAVLLTTPLSAGRILIGKILSSSALLALLLVVTLPLYSIVFLFGAAVPSEVAAVFGFQLFTTVIIATLSVLWSTIALRSGWSTVLSYATVGWMVMVTGFIGYALRLLAVNPIDAYAGSWADWLLTLNPLWIEASLENYVHGVRHGWVVFVLAYSLLAVVLVIPCVLRLRPHTLHSLTRLIHARERDYQ